MKIQYYLLALILLVNRNAHSKEIPENFDLTLKERFGCVVSVRTYINFHFENELFTITRASDDARLHFEKFTKDKFEYFYTKLQSFNLNQLDSAYFCEKWGTAMGLGSLEIKTNNNSQSIKFTTRPCDGTKFQGLHKWLNDFSSEINQIQTFQDLMDSKFYLIDYISEWAVLQTVEENSKQLDVDDFIATIDSTKNSSLKTILIQCLQYFQDEKILDLLVPMLIENLNNIEDQDAKLWRKYNSIILSSITSQKKSDKKSEYLIAFLESENKKVRINSAIALAKDKDSTGVDVIIESINECYKGRNHCVKWDEFSALTYLDKTVVLPKLISNYKSIQNRNKIIKKYPWILKGYIASIINFLGDKKYLSPEDLRLICLDMNINTEMEKIEKQLNDIE